MANLVLQPRWAEDVTRREAARPVDYDGVPLRCSRRGLGAVVLSPRVYPVFLDEITSDEWDFFAGCLAEYVPEGLASPELRVDRLRPATLIACNTWAEMSEALSGRAHPILELVTWSASPEMLERRQERLLRSLFGEALPAHFTMTTFSSAHFLLMAYSYGRKEN